MTKLFCSKHRSLGLSVKLERTETINGGSQLETRHLTFEVLEISYWTKNTIERETERSGDSTKRREESEDLKTIARKEEE